MRGEKHVNEPDGLLGLAYSEIESAVNLITSDAFSFLREGEKNCTFSHTSCLYMVITTQFGIEVNWQDVAWQT